jgi:toxin ParE1/3/4
VAFFLTQKALGDLKAIARYTDIKWGREHRNKYLHEMDACFQALAEKPDAGKPCDAIRPGYRKQQMHKHVVFYRLLPNSLDVEIVRILHERMDFEARLEE